MAMALGSAVVAASDPKEDDPPAEEEEEEMVDPLDTLKDECKEASECEKYKLKLDECTARVSSTESEEDDPETCAEELYDFMHCVDHCVSKSLFSKLK